MKLKRFFAAYAAISMLVPLLRAEEQRQSIGTVTADGRTVTVTAISPAIVRVDNTAAGEETA
ncbi:MAG: hypothetical protein K2I04_02110, partial [Muribaculaceae bacterium]|nr:hypothetical protein [Muribaculaceae bacterium]